MCDEIQLNSDEWEFGETTMGFEGGFLAVFVRIFDGFVDESKLDSGFCL